MSNLLTFGFGLQIFITALCRVVGTAVDVVGHRFVAIVRFRFVVSFVQFHRAHERGIVFARKSAALMSGGHFSSENRSRSSSSQSTAGGAANSDVGNLCGKFNIHYIYW